MVLGEVPPGLPVLRVLSTSEFVGLTTRHPFLNLFAEMGDFGEIRGAPICSRLSTALNRNERLLCSASIAECSCSNCANRAPRLLTLARRSSCWLWENSINPSKYSMRSGEGRKLGANVWDFWELMRTGTLSASERVHQAFVRTRPITVRASSE